MSAKIYDPAFPDHDVVRRLDVGDEVRSKEALREAGALQTAIFNSVNFSSIATDANGVIQIFNVGAERMLGYTAAEVMNQITPADISDPQEVIARAKALSVELGTPITPGFEALVFKASRGIEDIYELTYIRKDGSRFPAVVSVTALRDAQDAIIGYLLIGTDNTARKQAEEALLKAGALQSAIFNSANFSSIATDAKGVIQIFNVGAERMLGYTAAEVMNQITPADISDPQEVIARAKALSVELGTPITPGFEALVFKASRGIEDIYELTYIRKDGSRFPAVVSVTALRDAQDAIIGYLLIGTDNTARKQVEEERKKLDQRLRDQQFYTRSLIESNIDALMTTDPSGIITDVNKQMEALTGCTRDELIGAPFKNYFTDPERAEAAIKQVLSEKKVTNYELTARARGGKQTVVSYNATTFYDRDRTLQGVFAAARDVTERNRLDQVLLEKNVELESAKSVAEQANLAKSDFLSSMSHELRSPLNAILGFAQLMESDSQSPTPSQKESIAQILVAGWHLLNLINEILDLAVIEAGTVSLSGESVSLDEVMLECRAMMEPQAQQRGISMTFPEFDNPCFVSSDRTRLKQILINLLSNAIKYNKAQGTVVVDYTVIAPDRIRINITDTGAGLRPEKLAQLFQPFNRLGQEAGGEEGTGIGLVVTKRLVELMGGAIGVDSTVGTGSVFWIELISAAPPQLAVEGGEAAAYAPLHVPHGARLRTLLCVEDNPANLKLVEELIARRPDLRLLTAVNGTLGIELARASQPEMILMDVNLPDISGIEAMKILREDPVTAHIPIVALSANAMPRDIRKGLEAGFFRYLTKPIKVNEFMDTLRMALEFAEQRAAERPAATGNGSLHAGRHGEGRAASRPGGPHDGAADPRRRGPSGEPGGGEADPAAAGASRRGRRGWPRGARRARAVSARGVRSRADGPADAGDGRARGHGRNPRRRARLGDAPSDRGADRARDAGRPRTVPGGRHGRVRHEADRRRRAGPRHRPGRAARCSARDGPRGGGPGGAERSRPARLRRAGLPCEAGSQRATVRKDGASVSRRLPRPDASHATRDRRRRRRGAARARARVAGRCGKFRSRSGGRSRTTTRAPG